MPLQDVLPKFEMRLHAYVIRDVRVAFFGIFLPCMGSVYEDGATLSSNAPVDYIAGLSASILEMIGPVKFMIRPYFLY